LEPWGRLAFGELETLAGARLSSFFALFGPGVTAEEPLFFEVSTEFGIDLYECPGNGEPHRPDLAVHPTTGGVNIDIVGLGSVGDLEREEETVLQSDRREIVFERALVDGDVP